MNPNHLRVIPMQHVATGLLAAMVVVYLGVQLLGGQARWVGYVRAFAEAALVGGLADWFAVTALFRHPLGVPIPHTAIIPRNKDRIGDALAGFIRANFITPDVIARRIRNVDFASRIGRFLVAGLEGPRRTRVGAMTLLIDLIDSLDHTRLGTLVKDGIDVRMRRIDFAPMLGQTLAAAIAEDRHIPLMNGFINWAAKTLDANEDLVRAMVHERAGTVLRWTGLDENLATAILEGLRKLLDEMATDPQHPMFRKAEEGLARLANDLRTDERLAVRVTHYRDILIDNPAMRFWLEGLWSQARQNLVAILASPDRISSGAIGAAARALGSAMQDNARVRLIMNRFARRTLIGLGVRYGEDVMTLVSETVRGWDAGTVTRRLEGVVGRDLQYIRLNGTLVGGLVGVLIHAIDAAL